MVTHCSAKTPSLNRQAPLFLGAHFGVTPVTASSLRSIHFPIFGAW